MKVCELIANLHDIDPDGEAEVQIVIRLRWGTRSGEISNVEGDFRTVRIVEAVDPEV